MSAFCFVSYLVPTIVIKLHSLILVIIGKHQNTLTDVPLPPCHLQVVFADMTANSRQVSHPADTQTFVSARFFWQPDECLIFTLLVSPFCVWKPKCSILNKFIKTIIWANCVKYLNESTVTNVHCPSGPLVRSLEPLQQKRSKRKKHAGVFRCV